MKTSSLFFLLILGCANSELKGKALSDSLSPPSQRDQSIKLMVQCPSDPKMKNMAIGGSGVIVSARRVLTAAHVVPCKDADIRALQPMANRPLKMKLEISFPDLDLARLITVDEEFKDVAPIVIGNRLRYEDRVCLAIGFPRVDRRCGMVEGLSFGRIESSPSVEPGNSGSGVYVNGRLVGIVTNQRRGRSGIVVGNISTSLIGREWVLE